MKPRAGNEDPFFLLLFLGMYRQSIEIEYIKSKVRMKKKKKKKNTSESASISIRTKDKNRREGGNEWGTTVILLLVNLKLSNFSKRAKELGK